MSIGAGCSEKERIQYELLIARCRRGETRGWNDLIEGWEPRLFYYVRRLVPTEEIAWDVLQETWMKVLRMLPTLRDPRSLPLWLYRISRNTAISALRKQYLDAALLTDVSSSVAHEAEATSTVEIGTEDAQLVHEAIGKLPVAQRELVTLFYLEDLTVNDIAQLLEVPPGTVKSRLHHARAALRAELCKTESLI